MACESFRIMDFTQTDSVRSPFDELQDSIRSTDPVGKDDPSRQLTRYRHCALHGMKDFSKLFMFAIHHFIAVSLAVTAGLMRIRWVAVEER
jgi:hypothetical protein